jgi:restriction endonuclease
MSEGPKLLFQCERKRRKLRRIVRDLSRFFRRAPSSGFESSKSGPFAPKTGLVMMPNGTYVPEAVREDELRFGDFEFEAAQESYLLGELGATDEDCRELLHAIEQGRWDDCEDLFETIIGRLDDIQLGERVTRRKFDPLCDEFHEALEFIQTVEFGTLWIPSDTELLTPEQFEFVDKKLAEQIASAPEMLFSIDPRFFEELIGSIYADLDYEVMLTKRTQDGGRDIIALVEKTIYP